LLDAKKVPIKDRPAKTIYYDNPYIGKHNQEQTKFAKDQIKKLEQHKANNSASLKRYAGLGDNPPSIPELTQRSRAIAKEIELKEAELKRITGELAKDAEEIAKVGAKYETKLGSKFSKELMAKAGRRLARLNMVAEVVEALAFLLACVMAPEKLGTIFDGKNSVDGIKLLTLTAQERMEGDKTNSINGTTDIRKSSQHGTAKEVMGGITTDNPSAHANDKGKKKILLDNKEPKRKEGNGNMKEILKILDTHPQAKILWGTLLANGVLKGAYESLLKEFTAQHAYELVRIAKKYGSKVNIDELAGKYAKGLEKAAKNATMNDYLQMLEGICERAIDKEVQGEDETTLKVDRENQHVVHDKGLEKEKGKFEGSARKAEEIPADTKTGKMSGRYIITWVESMYKVGSTLLLNFVGTYNGTPALFENIEVVVVCPPQSLDNGKVKYVVVKYAKNQTIPLKNGKHHVYFSAKADEFNVRIK
jgi:hypothetical protein